MNHRVHSSKHFLQQCMGQKKSKNTFLCQLRISLLQCSDFEEHLLDVLLYFLSFPEKHVDAVSVVGLINGLSTCIRKYLLVNP